MTKNTDSIQKAAQKEQEQKGKRKTPTNEKPWDSKKPRNPYTENEGIGEIHSYKAFRKRYFNLTTLISSPSKHYPICSCQMPQIEH